MTYAELLAENKTQKELINSLKHQLDQLQKLIFGAKRERFVPDVSPGQLNLFSDLIVAVPEEVEKQSITYERTKPKKHPGRTPLPDHLPCE